MLHGDLSPGASNSRRYSTSERNAPQKVDISSVIADV